VVPGGTFKRLYDGVSNKDVNNPATVSTFRLDKFEVTVGRFRAFVKAYPGSKPAAGAGAHPKIAGSGWQSAWDSNLPADQGALIASRPCAYARPGTWTDTPGANEDLPIACTNWYQSFAFCAWDGGRLPTEAEWNYAAAGGAEQRVYAWSNPPNSTTIDTSYIVELTGQADSYMRVGSKPRGDGRWGHSDLAGSVNEWSLDTYSGTLLNPCSDCANLSGGGFKVEVGGGQGGDYTTSWRINYPPLAGDYVHSVRCARAE